ncbi:hypothetical protein HZ326_5826 [Fusarium oxysporum f. sp. albedinis]|nr:hypothetical protein HZ326_5826 [Fusarium oxysporum f. sp. albedinis]
MQCTSPERQTPVHTIFQQPSPCLLSIDQRAHDSALLADYYRAFRLYRISTSRTRNLSKVTPKYLIPKSTLPSDAEPTSHAQLSPRPSPVSLSFAVFTSQSFFYPLNPAIDADRP